MVMGVVLRPLLRPSMRMRVPLWGLLLWTSCTFRHICISVVIFLRSERVAEPGSGNLTATSLRQSVTDHTCIPNVESAQLVTTHPCGRFYPVSGLRGENDHRCSHL